ncbi:FAD-dependent oxidoreductase [Spirochaetota bacterium]
MIYDVAIVGAGPSGLHAAKWAAKKGLKAVLIEKRKDISHITRYCSEHLILEEGYNGDTIEVDTVNNKVISTRFGWEVKYDGELYPTTDKMYHSPKGHIVHFAWPDRRPFAYKYDKGYLLNSILNECLDLGVTYMNETVAYDGNETPQGVVVKVVSKGKKTTINARKLIIADGCITRMGDAFGFNANRGYLGNALVVATYLSGVETYDPKDWKLYYGRAYGSNLAPITGTGPAGHMNDWMDIVNMGSASMPPLQTYENFTTKSPLAHIFKNAKIEERYCCAVRAYTPIKEPCKGNAMIIGDSAAFVEVQGQGGLTCGYLAAEAIAKELDGKPGFKKYTKEWLTSFEFNAEGQMEVSQAYAFVPKYEDDEIDYLFSLCEDVLLEGNFSQYKTARLIWETILRDPEKIERERPEVYAKIKSTHAASLQDSIS